MNKNEHILRNVELLNAFVTIADCGNLTTAAGLLGRTQSAISVQMRKLESGLNTSLFLRNAKGMALTPAGETLLPRALGILSEIRETALLFSKPLTGSVRVGFPDDYDETGMEFVLRAFARTHPGVRVLAVSGCTSSYPKDVREGGLDVAICSGPEFMDGRPLNAEETVWAAHKDLVFQTREPVPLAILDRNCWWRDLPTGLLDAAGVPYEIAFRSNSFTSIQAALRAGLAVAPLPATCLTGELKALTKKDGFPDLPTACRTIMVSDQADESLVNAMVDAILTVRQAPAEF